MRPPLKWDGVDQAFAKKRGSSRQQPAPLQQQGKPFQSLQQTRNHEEDPIQVAAAQSRILPHMRPHLKWDGVDRASTTKRWSGNQGIYFQSIQQKKGLAKDPSQVAAAQSRMQPHMRPPLNWDGVD